MDKRSLLAVLLITVIMILYQPYMKWLYGDQQPAVSDSLASDSTYIVPPDSFGEEPQLTTLPEEEPATDTLAPVDEVDVDTTEEMVAAKEIKIESELMSIQFTTANGGRFSRWQLHEYESYLGGGVDLASHRNGLNLQLRDRNGKQVQTIDYTLLMDDVHSEEIFLDVENPTASIEAYLPLGDGRIVFSYTFSYDQYSTDVSVRMENLDNYILKRNYFISWLNGLEPTEETIAEDYDYGRAFLYQSGDLEKFDVDEEGGKSESYGGRADYTAIRTKYFVVALLPDNPRGVESTSLEGDAEEINDLLHKNYSMTLEVPYSQTANHQDQFTLFLGPLDLKTLGSYDVDLDELVMNKDWYEGFALFRNINIYLILPAFDFMHGFIPNYGLIIIIFSILVKIVLHPITKKSYQSMSAMQELNPKLTKLREQYKDDPQRLNQESMKLFKEHGANPASGCIPMLLQMPLLIALFTVFRSTIQLRGEPFVAWITDLSKPDALELGFALPFIGDTIHVLPILMAATMVWQSKMTMTDPRQKMMMYFMPLFMLFFFYTMPSGLNLYYSLFNILSMAQTRMIKKNMPSADKKAQGGPGTNNKGKPQALLNKQNAGQRSSKKKKR